MIWYYNGGTLRCPSRRGRNLLVQHEARVQIDADKMTLGAIVEAMKAVRDALSAQNVPNRAEISFDHSPADPLWTVVAEWDAEVDD